MEEKEKKPEITYLVQKQDSNNTEIVSDNPLIFENLQEAFLKFVEEGAQNFDEKVSFKLVKRKDGVQTGDWTDEELNIIGWKK